MFLEYILERRAIGRASSMCMFYLGRFVCRVRHVFSYRKRRLRSCSRVDRNGLLAIGFLTKPTQYQNRIFQQLSESTLSSLSNHLRDSAAEGNEASNTSSLNPNLSKWVEPFIVHNKNFITKSEVQVLEWIPRLVSSWDHSTHTTRTTHHRRLRCQSGLRSRVYHQLRILARTSEGSSGKALFFLKRRKSPWRVR